MQSILLLLEDVDDLGKKGEIVKVKPGYARNFLLPRKRARIADANSIRMQKRLQEERAKQAVIDLADSESMVERLKEVVLETTVKVDHEGNMYGSVSVVDLIELFNKAGFQLEKKWIILPQPYKTVGEHEVKLRLKEDISTTVKLNIVAESE